MAETTKERLTPHNTEAEQSTLGSMMISRDAVATAGEILQPSDFYRRPHQLVFEATKALFDKGEPVDLVTVSAELQRRGQLEEVGGPEYLATLIESVPSAANVARYARLVEEKAILRGLILTSDQIQGWCYDGAEEVETLLDRAEHEVLKVGQRRAGGEVVPIQPLLHQTFEDMLQQYQRGGAALGLRSHFPGIDALTSGFRKSSLIVIAARPSVGKTSLCLNIARNVAVNEKLPVLVFSLEMSKEQLVERFLCGEARVNAQHLRQGTMTEADWDRLTLNIDRLYNAPIFIDDSPTLSTFEMRARARRMKAEHGLGMIVVDYLQLVRSPERWENRTQEVSAIARSLKSLAREMEVPLLAAAQLGRGVEQREDKRPLLSDLRESGSIEAEADLVLFIHRDAAYGQRRKSRDEDDGDEPPVDDRSAKIVLAKHRYGPTGEVNLLFFREWALFETPAGEQFETAPPVESVGLAYEEMLPDDGSAEYTR